MLKVARIVFTLIALNACTVTFATELDYAVLCNFSPKKGEPNKRLCQEFNRKINQMLPKSFRTKYSPDKFAFILDAHWNVSNITAIQSSITMHNIIRNRDGTFYGSKVYSTHTYWLTTRDTIRNKPELYSGIRSAISKSMSDLKKYSSVK